MGACGSVNAAPTGKISAATAAGVTPTAAPTTAQQTSQQLTSQSDVTGTQSITTTTTTTTTTMTTSNIVRVEPTHKKTLLKQDSSMMITPRHGHHHETSKELQPRDSIDDSDSTTSSDVENDKIVNEMMRENDERIASLNRILASSTPTSTTSTTTKARPRLSIHSDKEIKSSNKSTSKTTPDTPRSNEKAKNKALEEAEEQLRLAREKVEMINLLKQMNETPSKWLQQLADQDASQASFEAKLTQLQKLKSEATERVRIEREQRLQQAVTDMSNAKFDEFQAAIQRDKAAYDATVLKEHAGANARERAMQRQLTAEEAAAEAKRLEDETIAFRAQLAATDKEKENVLVKSVKKQKAKAEVETRIRAAETAATQAEEAARKAKMAAETARALAEQAKTKALEHSPSLSTVGPQQPRTGSISMSYDFDHHIELDELEPVDERGGRTKSSTSSAIVAKKIPTLVSSRSSSHLNCDPEEEMRRLTAELHALFRVMNTTDEMGKPSLEGLSKTNITMKRTSGALTSPMKQRLQSEIAAKRAEIERLELQLLTAEQCEERVRVMDHDAQAMDAGTARDVALKKVSLWSMHAQLKRKQEAALVKENEKAAQEAHVFAMMQEALAAEKLRQQRAMG